MTGVDDALLQGIWTLRDRVEARLERVLVAHADCPDDLRQAMSYSLLAGGKRLRPILALLACEAAGGNPDRAMPAAVAIEMVHTYSLIHDDLPAMDDDDFRRGQPTNHKVFGEAMAILAGDALLTLAFEVVAREVQPPAIAAACCADLASAAGWCGMVAGQVADIAAEQTPVGTVNQLEAIHRRKTGRLLCSALTMGARIAEASNDVFQRLEGYGQRVGLAFQIADDLLDITSSQEKLGKGTQKDANLGKLTYPALLGLEESRHRCLQLVQEARDLVAPLGQGGAKLGALATYVAVRDH